MQKVIAPRYVCQHAGLVAAVAAALLYHLSCAFSDPQWTRLLEGGIFPDIGLRIIDL